MLDLLLHIFVGLLQCEDGSVDASNICAQDNIPVDKLMNTDLQSKEEERDEKLEYGGKLRVPFTINEIEVRPHSNCVSDVLQL